MGKKKAKGDLVPAGADYEGLLARVSSLLEQGRRATARTTSAILSPTYWEVGRQIVEYEQGGEARAEYGEEIVDRLARDPAARYGRGFSRRNYSENDLEEAITQHLEQFLLELGAGFTIVGRQK